MYVDTWSIRSLSNAIISLLFFPSTDVKVRDVAWNPNISETIAVLLTNGHILMVELNGSQAKIPASMPGPMTAGEN